MAAAESPQEREIGAALARVTSEFYGRGPRSTRTWVLDQVVFSALDDPFTVADEALLADGRADLVRDVRLTFQDVMARSFVSAVEEHTGRAVVGYHSQIVFDPPVALEWFLLDDQRPRSARGGADPQALARDDPGSGAGQPGAVGDADAVTADAPSIPSQRSADAGGDGSQRAAISNAVNRIVSTTAGRGSPAVRTYILDRFVLVVLEDALTTVERTLLEAGSGELARQFRRELTGTMQGELGAEVQRVLGRGVAAIESQLVTSPDAVLLAFVLAGSTGSGTQAES